MTVMLVGIGFVALPTAAAAERFIKDTRAEDDVRGQLAEINDRLIRLEELLRSAPDKT